ncbi:MAG: hypothetical protein Q7J60_13650 [Bradyrhizobium sp.]|nr:hypothetical protein [Bradyrhizobium sp.]
MSSRREMRRAMETARSPSCSDAERALLKRDDKFACLSRRQRRNNARDYLADCAAGHHKRRRYLICKHLRYLLKAERPKFVFLASKDRGRRFLITIGKIWKNAGHLRTWFEVICCAICTRRNHWHFDADDRFDSGTIALELSFSGTRMPASAIDQPDDARVRAADALAKGKRKTWRRST